MSKIMTRSMGINRRDIVTNNIFDRDELIRISIKKDGVTNIDYNNKLGGRGIYIHPTSIEKGLKRKILAKRINKFGGSLENILEELEKEIKNG